MDCLVGPGNDIMPSMTAAVETPSGKSTASENFPVGSFLLPAHLRPHVATFYGFARAIDDIADNPQLASEVKIARLDGFAAALTGKAAGPGFEKAERLRESLAATGVTAQHGLDLIAAFKLDAVKPRYADWTELIERYCMLSAAPVGRYLLDLHGEARSGYRASDALCNALQVLNHLQDCQDDYRQLDRVYLPQDWLAAAGSKVEDLDSPTAGAGMRRVIDQCLDGSDDLIAVARTLPGQLRNRRLAMESAVIVRIAERLSRLLRRRDPLAGQVKLSRMQFLCCALTGIGWGMMGRRG
jgi:squalene synthase HpnC